MYRRQDGGTGKVKDLGVFRADAKVGKHHRSDGFVDRPVDPEGRRSISDLEGPVTHRLAIDLLLRSLVDGFPGHSHVGY